MIVQEKISETLIRTYSDSGFYIHGGYPESNYEETVDPISEGRTYTETDIPIVQTYTSEELEDAGRIMMGIPIPKEEGDES